MTAARGSQETQLREELAAALTRVDKYREVLGVKQILEAETVEEIFVDGPTTEWLLRRKGEPHVAELLAAEKRVRELEAQLRTVVEVRNWRTKDMTAEQYPALAMERAEPPLRAEKLLTLALPATLIDPVIGDLGGRFPRIQQRHGARFARVWYWRQVLGCILHLLPVRVLKWASAGTLVEVVRRVLSR
jgi:hypothetical protein